MTDPVPARPTRPADLTRDQLAQYRGCWPDNECYHDCCEAAQGALDDPRQARNPGELQRAAVWADSQVWHD